MSSYDEIAQKYNATNVSLTRDEAPSQPKKSGVGGFVQGVTQAIAKPFIKTATLGMASAKGLYSFAKGDISGANKAVQQDYDFGYFGSYNPSEMARIDNIGQFTKNITGTGLEIASNFVGAGGAVKGVGLLAKSKLLKAAYTGTKVGAQVGGLSSAGQSLQEDKSMLETGVDTAIGTAIGGTLGALTGVAGVVAKTAVTPMKTVIENISPVFKNAAIKVEKALIKPVKREMESGFNAENIFKYNVGGTLEESYTKITELLKGLRGQASGMRESSSANINIKQLLDDVVTDLETNKFGQFGTRQKLDNAVEMFVKEVEMLSPRGYVSVPQAQEIKEAVGTLGSWLYGSRDLEANATEKVANILYTKVKDAIEKNSPAGLGDINKQMSDLIPIKNAIIRRIPIADRNNVISLTDIISAGFALQNPKSWGLFVLNRLSKSGGFAQTLYKAGAKLESGAKKLLPIETKIQDKILKTPAGLSLKDVSKDNPLIQQAQKMKAEGKTVDKFIDSQETMYHGTGSDTAFKIKKGSPLFITPNKGGALTYGDKLEEFYLPKDIKLFDATNYNKNLGKYVEDITTNYIEKGKGAGYIQKWKNIFNEFEEKTGMYLRNEMQIESRFADPKSLYYIPDEKVRSQYRDAFYWLNQIENPHGKALYDNWDKIIERVKKDGYDAIKANDTTANAKEGISSYVVFDQSKLLTKSQLTDIWNKANKK